MRSTLFEKNQQAATDTSKSVFQRLFGWMNPRRWINKTSQETSSPLPSPEFPYGYRVFWGRWGNWLQSWAHEGLWRLFTPNFKIGLTVTGLLFFVIYIAFKFEFLKITSDKLEFGSINGTLAGILTLITVSMPFILKWSGFFTKAFQSGEAQSKDNYSMGSADPLYRFRSYFAQCMIRFRRPMLVVIDDLDRCNAAYIVELIRGMQTVLLSRRVVFVLLGDRDWIEQAFAIHYKDMQGIDVGKEHEFGAKFVEKAIQLSMVLPDIQVRDKQKYVRHILGVKDLVELEPIEVQQNLDEIESEFKSNMTTSNFVEREKVNADLINRLEQDKGIPKDLKRETIQNLNRRASIKSATDKTVETATKHRLENIAELLPANPRQIKRIVNTSVLVQEIARVTENAQIGKDEWQLLIRWIILADVFPKTWYTLSRNLDVFDNLYNEGVKTGYGNDISNNLEAMKLLEFADDFGGNWSAKNQIDKKAAEWLIRVMPPTSGKMLKLDTVKKAGS